MSPVWISLMVPRSLQRFQSFLRTQNDQGKIRRLLKTQENSARLENCKIDLQQAVDIFSVSGRTEYSGHR